MWHRPAGVPDHPRCPHHQAPGPQADPDRWPDGIRLRRERLARELKGTEQREPRMLMLGMILRRVCGGVLTLLIVSLVVFIGTNILPGDATEAILGQSASPEAVAGLRH